MTITELFTTVENLSVYAQLNQETLPIFLEGQ